MQRGAKVVLTCVGVGVGLMAVASVQGGTAPAPIATALGQVAPVTTAPVATRAVATTAPASTAASAPGPAEDVAPEVTASAYYANCAAAKADGAAPLHRGDPGYRSGLDRDRDGIACELR